PIIPPAADNVRSLPGKRSWKLFADEVGSARKVSDPANKVEIRIEDVRTEPAPVPGPGQTLPPCTSAGEAMARLLDAAAYLASMDKVALTGEELAGHLRGYKDAESLLTAARAATMTRFRHTGAFEADGCRTAKAW